MADKTFTNGGVDNLWSTPGNWNGGTVPVDNQSVEIAAGQTCEYDVDWSSVITYPNGLNGLIITGTLKISRVTSSYMKLKAATTISGAGTFNVGESALLAIPFAVKCTITGGVAWYIQGSGGLTMTVYAAEPAIKTVLTSGVEAIGQTEIGVATDVSGDIWTAGDTIRIDDINKAAESEERIIAAGAIASDHIDITAGLTAAKAAGAVVSLITRNVKFVAVGGHMIQNFAANKLTVAGGQFTGANYRIMTSCVNPAISGGAFTGGTYISYSSTGGVSITGGVFSGNTQVTGASSVVISGGSFSGNTSVVYNFIGGTISGGTFSGNNQILYAMTGTAISGGSFNGNTYILFICAGITISGGTFTGNDNAIFNSSAIIKNGSFSSNTYDIYQSIVLCFNTLLGSTENYLYQNLSRETYSESIDHDQSAGAFKAWTKGGATSSQTATPPTGFTQYNQTVLENAAVEGYWQKEVLVNAGASVTISMCLRKTAAMTYLPRCIVFNKASTDPFAGGAGLNTFTMTDSINTWEYGTYTYTNTGSADVTLVIRCQGMNATGNMLSMVGLNVLNVDLTTALANLATIIANLAVVDANVDAVNLLADDIVALIMSK